MFLGEVFQVLMLFLFGTIIAFYSSYLVCLSYYNKKSGANSELMDFSYPSVSLLVPVYNEEQIISDKLKNIEEIVYPNDKFEVIFNI
jgi:cellulose synthase/poly-beta-1,6-N-acetylglucosamine synthase-like glycosyltransferase